MLHLFLPPPPRHILPTLEYQIFTFVRRKMRLAFFVSFSGIFSEASEQVCGKESHRRDEGLYTYAIFIPATRALYSFFRVVPTSRRKQWGKNIDRDMKKDKQRMKNERLLHRLVLVAAIILRTRYDLALRIAAYSRGYAAARTPTVDFVAACSIWYDCVRTWYSLDLMLYGIVWIMYRLRRRTSQYFSIGNTRLYTGVDFFLNTMTMVKHPWENPWTFFWWKKSS